MPCSPFMLKEIASFAGGAHPFLRVGVGRAVGPLRGVLGLGARFAFELVVVLVREVVRFVPHGTSLLDGVLVLDGQHVFLLWDTLWRLCVAMIGVEPISRLEQVRAFCAVCLH